MSWCFPSFLAAPTSWRVGAGGSAKPIACDAAGRDLDTAAASGTLEREEGGSAQHRSAQRMSQPDRCASTCGPACAGRASQGRARR